jgi:hypothetical protein
MDYLELRPIEFRQAADIDGGHVVPLPVLTKAERGTPASFAEVMLYAMRVERIRAKLGFIR